MAQYGPVWPSVVMYGPAWTCMGLCGPIWPCVAQCGPVWPSVALCGPYTLTLVHSQCDCCHVCRQLMVNLGLLLDLLNGFIVADQSDIKVVSPSAQLLLWWWWGR